jgi:hypothetical protein
MESVEKSFRACLVMPRFLDVDPLRAFAIACHCRLEAEAKLAAQATFGRPLSTEPYVPELELITGGHLHRLLKYHDSCAAACKEITSDFTWIDNTSFFWFNQNPGNFPTANIGPSRTARKVNSWWLGYMRGVAAALENHTWDEATRTSLMQTAQQEDKGLYNNMRFRVEFPEFIDLLMAKLKEVISEVGLIAYFGLHPPHSHRLFTGSVGSSLLARDIIRRERMPHRRKYFPCVTMNRNDSSCGNVISSCVMYITICHEIPKTSVKTYVNTDSDDKTTERTLGAGKKEAAGRSNPRAR